MVVFALPWVQIDPSDRFCLVNAMYYECERGLKHTILRKQCAMEIMANLEKLYSWTYPTRTHVRIWDTL
jgi:hypothetical protein